MADYSQLFSAALVAATQTALPAAGIPAGAAGTYTLNICNDSGDDVAIDALCLTTGGAPTPADKVHPAFEVEARGWAAIQPIKMGEGWKLYIKASGPVSVQLIGRKEG